MNPTQAENLRILIRHMETRVTRVLDMEKYFNPVCRTPACALGEATLVPELAHLGMRAGGLLFMHHSQDFASSIVDRKRLFSTSDNNAWGRAAVTPQEWATEARKVLAEHGYSMDTDTEWADAKVRSLATLPPMGDEQPSIAEVIASYAKR